MTDPVQIQFLVRPAAPVEGDRVHGGAMTLEPDADLTARRQRAASALHALAAYVEEGRADDLLTGGEAMPAPASGTVIAPLG